MSAGGGPEEKFFATEHAESTEIKRKYDEDVKSQKHALSLERERAGVRVEG